MKSIKWQPGMLITEPGIYEGIPLDEYHGNRELFDGPSISKSNLKWLLPPHGGSPKAFWGRWKWNPDRIDQKTSTALDFGKAVHCLLLGDEVFKEKFIIRPDKAPDGKAWNGNNNSCKAWLKEAADAGLTALKAEDIERIKKIAEDAGKYDLIQQGILNGAIERTICAKDPETGIWLSTRPDACPAPGTYSDLKTASSFSEDFLERQFSDACYYLQGGMTKFVCDLLGLPFEEFYLVYVLNDDVPDTTHVPISPHEIDRGERSIKWCLKIIRRCLDSGVWPGARPFNEGNNALQMKPWAKTQIDEFLERAEHDNFNEGQAA